MRISKRIRALLFCLLLCLPSLAHAAVTVDFDYLQTLNEDCVGWLYQPESGLNQPVMQHETDGWYHERAFDQTRVYKMGSAYLLAKASTADPVIVVHGQARAEGCLSVIPEWAGQEVFDQRSPFRFLTPEGSALAEPFACLTVEERHLNSWLPGAQPFEDWLEQVQTECQAQAASSLLPTADDRLLFIAAHHLNGNVTLLMTRLTPDAAAGDPINLTKMALDAAETANGLVDAGPAGQLMYYAQNDPLYAAMRYESAIRNDVHRDFGGGGCGPTAMAIIAANLVSPDDLPLLGAYASNPLGNLFCPCTVNRVYCDHSHVPYRLETPDEYLRYLPVAMGDFAAGNNQWEYVARRVNSQGTNIRFVDYVCEAYGLSMTPVTGLESALELMKTKTGKGFILTSALRGSPYTNNSHFVVITGVDEEYFYVLDPLRRTEEEYAKTDSRELLELLSPGVTRIRLEDCARSDLSPVCYISKEP